MKGDLKKKFNTVKINDILDKKFHKINLFFKKHPFIKSIRNFFCWLITIVAGIYIGSILTNTDELLANGFASVINTINQKTEEIKYTITNNNNEVCNLPNENQWIITGKNIQVNQNHLLFKYEQGYKGSEVTYINKIEFSDSKDLILKFSSKDIIENDAIFILLKDDMGNTFLKIETSKLDIKIFIKNNGEWIEYQRIKYGKKIEDYPIFYFKLSLSKDGEHFRLSTIPKHKNYFGPENEFMNEGSINADIILDNTNYMNNIQLGIGVFTSLEHDIDIEIHDCKILK